MKLLALIVSATITVIHAQDVAADSSTLLQGIPSDWQSMEVESKWTTTSETFERIVCELSGQCGNNATMFGYDLSVRWGGIPRKFVDYYYDTDGGDLAIASHALRHRTRYTSNAKDRLFSTLVNVSVCNVCSRSWTRRPQYCCAPLVPMDPFAN